MEKPGKTAGGLPTRAWHRTGWQAEAMVGGLTTRQVCARFFLRRASCKKEFAFRGDCPGPGWKKVGYPGSGKSLPYRREVMIYVLRLNAVGIGVRGDGFTWTAHHQTLLRLGAFVAFVTRPPLILDYEGARRIERMW